MATRQADKRACTSGYLPTANQSEIRGAHLNSVFYRYEAQTQPVEIYMFKSPSTDSKGEKEMSKRSVVAIILMLCMSLTLLLGCTRDEAANGTDNSEISSVAEDVNAEVSESEVASEIDGEENAEEVSEESTETVSEEAIEEVDYSAEAVMGLIDDLIAKYPDENPEYIKAVVVAANLDYISEEDLNAILTEYGYTLEDMSVLYTEYVTYANDAYEGTSAYYQGDIEPDVYFDTIMPFYEVTMNGKDRQYMELCYDCRDERYRIIAEVNDQYNKMYYDAIDKGTYSSGMMVCDAVWIDPTLNPYEQYGN